jgi:hypothetical protein
MSEQLVAVIASTKGRGRCRGEHCDASITWYRTHPANRAMPFTGEPVPRKSERVDGELIEYMSADDCHWASCPDAPAFKRGKR